MELCSVLHETGDGSMVEKHTQPDAAMDDCVEEGYGELQRPRKEEEEVGKGALITALDRGMEMVLEEREVSSQMEEQKGADLRH